MTMTAQQGYGQVKRETSGPRTIEAQLLCRIAADLESADPSTADGYRALAHAVRENTSVWLAFSTDLVAGDNQLEDDLKARLLSLATFSLRHGNAVLQGDASTDSLVEINRAVASGLRSAASVAA